MKVACIAAFKMELKWLLSELSNPRRMKTPGTRVWVGGLGEHEVALFICGMGPGKARDSLKRLGSLYRADHIFNLGVCGALDKGIPLYRPVVITRVLASYREHGSPVEMEDRWGEIGSTGEPDNRLSAGRGILVTHDSTVFSRRTREALRDKFSARYVDMEAWEVADFCKESGIPLTVVKAVSDFADVKSVAGFALHARRAADAAGKMVCEMIRML